MLSHIGYIYTVYQERSFSRAAKRLYVSQPWLSAAVKKTEQELGTQIFDRSTTPISLTDAGKYYISQIERILTIENEIRDYFSALATNTAEHLKIGSSMFFCTYVLPKLLEEFRGENPNIELTFEEGVTRDLFARLSEGKLDFVLEAEHADSSDFVSTAWCTEEIMLAVPAKNEINNKLSKYSYTFEEFRDRIRNDVQKPPVPISAFENESFILLAQGNDIYERSMTICRNAEFKPKISLYVAQMMTAYYLVCEGNGVAFLRSTIPQFVNPTDSVRFYRLDASIATRSIYLTRAKKTPTIIQKKLAEFFEECQVNPEQEIS